MYIGLKILLTALIVVVVSEISRRSTIIAGIVASIPLTSLLAIIWIYFETHDLENIKKFIKNSLNKNIEKKNISKTLLQKKWNKSQIRYAFEDIEWEQKWVLIKIEARLCYPWR